MLLERFAVDGRPARIVVVVTVAEAYIHCAKALRRAELWSSDSWAYPGDLPSAACILRDHARVDATVEEIEAALDGDLEATLWKPGGEPPTS